MSSLMMQMNEEDAWERQEHFFFCFPVVRVAYYFVVMQQSLCYAFIPIDGDARRCFHFWWFDGLRFVSLYCTICRFGGPASSYSSLLPLLYVCENGVAFSVVGRWRDKVGRREGWWWRGVFVALIVFGLVRRDASRFRPTKRRREHFFFSAEGDKRAN